MSGTPNPLPAVALVGGAARDYTCVDALLSADAIVILIPSLQTGRAFLPVEDDEEAPRGAIAAEAGLCIDLTGHRVLWHERDLFVSERELAMLATLSENPGRACAFAELAKAGGARWLGDTEQVHSAIKRLRRKLARAGADISIESVRGYGYRLAELRSDGSRSAVVGLVGRTASETDEPVQLSRRAHPRSQ